MRNWIFAAAIAAGLCGAAGPKAVDDSYAVLKRAKRFAIGPISESAVISAEEEALRAVMKNPEAGVKLRSLLSSATPAGQMYALLGLYELKDPAFERHFPKYAAGKGRVQIMEGCIVSDKPIKAVVAEIRRGEYK